jgi:ribosomal protein L7/L12
VDGFAHAYPPVRPGDAHQGAEIYRANGCVTCHSQQLRQTGNVFDVVLTDAGTNLTAVLAALNLHLKPAAELVLTDVTNALPRTILKAAPTKAAAEAVSKEFKTAGAKADLRVMPVGPDILRGWGLRRSVAADYLHDAPPLLGSQRVGPDLANVGMRLPDANWHLVHLYQPRAVVKDSAMPPYRYLFVTRKIGAAPSADALVFPAGFGPEAGYEVVPTDAARALVAYLQSLRVDAPLFEAPMTAPAK